MFKKLFSQGSKQAAVADTWVLGTIEVDGFNVLVRCRSSLPERSLRERYPFLVEIVWTYDGDPVTGMPVSPAKEAIFAFEDAMYECLGDSEFGQEGVTFIGAGEKLWRYFTPSPEQFTAELNLALRDHPAYPIVIEGYADPDWEALSSVIATTSRGADKLGGVD